MEEKSLVEVQEQMPLPVADESESKPQIFENTFDMSAMLKTAGNLGITDDEKRILLRPVNEDDVEIRPDGLIYLPWMEYASRLNEAFGNGNWALIPQGMPRFAGNTIYWGHWLLVRGKMMGFAIGEQDYQPRNRTMSYGDACEGAWSNSLMRNCKHLGISLELWKPSFIRDWIAKYGEKYWDARKNKYLWRKKGVESEEVAEEIKDAPTPEKRPSAPKPEASSAEDKVKGDKTLGGASVKSYKFMKRLAGQYWGDVETGESELASRYNVESTAQLNQKEVSDNINFLKNALGME